MHVSEIALLYNVVDNTNVHNPWQETIRYGALDVTHLAKFIHADRDMLLGGQFTLVVTCLDQIENEIHLHNKTILKNQLGEVLAKSFPDFNIWSLDQPDGTTFKWLDF
jgi:hypothetical protein